MSAPVPDPETGLPIGPEVDPTPAHRPERSIALEGRHVRLVPIDPERDTASLYAAVSGPDAARLFQYLFPRPPESEEAFRRFLESAARGDDPLFLAILDRATGRTLGHATFMRIEPNHRVIEVGNILYAPALQRTPGGTEAMYLMARHAFDELGYRRYEWKCNALNEPSRRAAERYGFTYEGTFRDHMIVKNRSRDTAWFSMLDTEWPARKRAFERYLAGVESGSPGPSLSVLNAPRLAVEGRTLRRAGPQDEAAFDAVQRAAFAWNRDMLGREPLPLLVPPAEILARYETWLLEQEGAVVGALALEPRDAELEIWSVSVSPGRQDAGLGRLLLAAAEERARALGLSTLRLFTGAPLTKNIDWYGRRGYEIERREDMPDRDRPDRQVVHMVKHIGQAREA